MYVPKNTVKHGIWRQSCQKNYKTRQHGTSFNDGPHHVNMQYRPSKLHGVRVQDAIQAAIQNAVVAEMLTIAIPKQLPL
eukprot:418023-Amphidinium_carterae.1